MKNQNPFKDPVNILSQGQIKCYQENHMALSNCLNRMKEIPLPQVKDSMFDPNDNDKK